MRYSLFRTLNLVVLIAILSNSAQPTEADTEEQVVKDILIAIQESWNQHDMEKFASLFSDDADFVNVRGMRWVGRSATRLF